MRCAWRLGDAAEVSFDAFPDQVFAAAVTEIGADADARTGTFQIKLKIAATAAPLKSGLVGRAAITPSVAAAVDLAIPVDAILEGHGNEALVFVVDPATGAAKSHPHCHRPLLWRAGRCDRRPAGRRPGCRRRCRLSGRR